MVRTMQCAKTNGKLWYEICRSVRREPLGHNLAIFHGARVAHDHHDAKRAHLSPERRGAPR